MSSQPAGPEVEPGREAAAEASPRIYVASLTDYNAGVLHGTWLSPGSGVRDLYQGIEEMLEQSPTAGRYGEVAEEWRIDDYEGWGPGVQINEFEDLEQLDALAKGLRLHGPAFGAWHQVRSDHGLDPSEHFEDHYLGEHESLEAWGEDQLEAIGFDLDSIDGIPESFRPYLKLDVEAWARDVRLSGDIATVESQGGLYVFWAH